MREGARSAREPESRVLGTPDCRESKPDRSGQRAGVFTNFIRGVGPVVPHAGRAVALLSVRRVHPSDRRGPAHAACFAEMLFVGTAAWPCTSAAIWL